MPNIREFNTTANFRAFQPNGEAAAALSQSADRTAQSARGIGYLTRATKQTIGQSIGALGKTAADTADDLLGRGESLKLGADKISTMNSLVSQWNTMRNTADPNDPNVAQRFNEQVLNPTLEKFGEGMISTAGQRGAIDFRQAAAEHFASVQQADAGIMAGEAAHQNIVTMANQSADLLSKDPSALAFVNGQVAQSIDDYTRGHPNLGAEQVAQIQNLKANVRRTNTMAAFHGMAEANPAAATEALHKGFGADDLTEADRSALDNYATAQANKLKEQDRADAVYQKQQDQYKSYAAADKLTTSLIQPDGTLAVNRDYYSGIQEIGKMPNVAPGLLTSMIDMGRSITREQEEGIHVVTDPHTLEDMNRRVMLEPSDPEKLELKDVVGARTAQKLSDKDFNRFRSDIADLQRDPGKKAALKSFTDFQNSMKSSITKSNVMSGGDPQGDQRWGQWQSLSREAFEQAYTNGSDWKAMLQPGSPNYLGNTASPYMIGSKAGIKEVQTNVKTGVELVQPPGGGRQKNESAADYLKRLGN